MGVILDMQAPSQRRKKRGKLYFSTTEKFVGSKEVFWECLSRHALWG